VRIKTGWIAVAAAACVGVLLAGSGVASALPVVGKSTSVDVTGADELFGLGITLASNAPVDGIGRSVFAITGGDFDIFFLSGTLVHQTDLNFSMSAGGSAVVFDHFVIDTTGVDFVLTATATVFQGANPPVVTPNLSLFTLTLCNAPAIFGECINNDGSTEIDGYGLLVTPDAATAIGSALGLDASSLVDVQFGIANIAIKTVVPEPGTLTLAGLGLAGLAASRRRRAA
jgi:hypothetical protein